MINKKDYFKKYNNQELFYQSGLSWEELENIADDYDMKQDIFQKTASEYVNANNSRE